MGSQRLSLQVAIQSIITHNPIINTTTMMCPGFLLATLLGLETFSAPVEAAWGQRAVGAYPGPQLTMALGLSSHFCFIGED